MRWGGRGRGWCQTLITLNTKYSIDGAGRRRHVFHVINVLPPHPIHPRCNFSTRTLFLICLIGNPLTFVPFARCKFQMHERPPFGYIRTFVHFWEVFCWQNSLNRIFTLEMNTLTVIKVYSDGNNEKYG